MLCRIARAVCFSSAMLPLYCIFYLWLTCFPPEVRIEIPPIGNASSTSKTMCTSPSRKNDSNSKAPEAFYLSLERCLKACWWPAFSGRQHVRRAIARLFSFAYTVFETKIERPLPEPGPTTATQATLEKEHWLDQILIAALDRPPSPLSLRVAEDQRRCCCERCSVISSSPLPADALVVQ